MKDVPEAVLRRKVKQEARDGYGPDGAWVGVVALDPGKVTGVAWMRARVAVLRDAGWMETLRTRQMLGGMEGGTGEVDCSDLVNGVSRLVDCLTKIGSDGAQRVVVCEDFSLFSGRRHVGKDALWSPRVAAGLQVMCGMFGSLGMDVADEVSHIGAQLAGWRRLKWEWQMSSEMGVVTDERLRNWDLYVPGDHARDAMRHLVVWLRKQKWETWLREERRPRK